MTLSAEQLVAATEWVESGHVRLRRRVVSETRTIEVLLRREELIIEVRDATPGQIGESYRGTALAGAAVAAPQTPGAPLIVLLHEEVPEILVRPRVYEQVTAEVITHSEVAVWHDSVRHEEAVSGAVDDS